MSNIRFNSLEELYNRLLPAMETKVNELKSRGIKYINVLDIWEYLKKYKWSNSNNLSLSDCVDDILNTNDEDYKLYIKEKMKDILGGK